MTVWAIKFGLNWLLLPLAVWFARGLWVATQRPLLKLVSVSKVSDTAKLVTVKRQQLAPPWMLLDEVYLLRQKIRDPRYKYLEEYLEPAAFRESDGSKADKDLTLCLVGLCAVQEAREAETEELSK